MRISMLSLATGAALLAMAGCATTSDETAAKAPQPAKPIDAARFYAGTWYEIGRRPMSLTNGCVAGGTTYTAKSATDVQVQDFCHSGEPDGKLKTVGGPATIQDPGANTKLHVKYRLFGFVPVGKDYWVLDHADDYAWFISADPSFHDLWIYTRSPRPSHDEVQALTRRASMLGYDVSQLEFPATGN